METSSLRTGMITLIFIFAASNTNGFANSKVRNARIGTLGFYSRSVKFESRLPVFSVISRRLFLFIEHASFQRQEIHRRSHEAAIAIFRGANDWLAAHVEAGVYDHRTACLLSKGFNDLPVKRIRLAPHGLYARGVVDVRDGGNFRSLDVELLNSPQGF